VPVNEKTPAGEAGVFVIGDRAGGTCDRSPDTWLTTQRRIVRIPVRDIHKLSDQARQSDGEPEPGLRIEKQGARRRRLNLPRIAGCRATWVLGVTVRLMSDGEVARSRESCEV